jgi:uncharacterized protein
MVVLQSVDKQRTEPHSHARVECEFKIVVSGPFGAGKTTLISTISDGPVVGTEVATNGAESLLKATTTVGMELGKFTIDDDDAHVTLSLFGTPGQLRFRFMWEILAKGMDAAIVLVDASNRDTWEHARDAIEFFSAVPDSCFLVGANRCVSDADVVALRGALALDDATVVMQCDVSDSLSAKALVVCALGLVLNGEYGADL